MGTEKGGFISRVHSEFSPQRYLLYILSGIPSAPLVANIMPHLQTLVSFIRHTLPKPLLVSLFYRLLVLHLASRILPLIGGDTWADEVGVDGGWDERPVRADRLPLTPRFDSYVCLQSSRVTTVLLTYRQTIFVTVYSHLLRKVLLGLGRSFLT